MSCTPRVWNTLGVCCAAFGVVCPTGFTASAQGVSTWDGGRPAWRVIGIALEGVEIEQAGQESLVGWHRVRAIEGEYADAAEPFRGLSETAWRAVSRLDRGDAFGAEPLFESIFGRYRGVSGPTAAAVAEGLLRCRLRRDARVGAMVAWLALYENLSAAPARRPLWGIDSPAIDRETLLAPALPPLWYDGPAARAFADQPDPAPPGSGSGGDEVAWAVRVLYRAAASHAVGHPIDATATGRAVTLASRREGSGFVANMVVAQIGGEQARRDARLLLERHRTPDAERWRAVWATIAIGRSLLRESSEADRRRGVLALISVHALDRGESPYLTGLALADAALGCAWLGDDHAAGTLAGELRREMPTHPVLEQPALRGRWGVGPGRVSTP